MSITDCTEEITMESSKHFGSYLKAVMNQMNMNHSRFSNHLCIDPRTLKSIEEGSNVQIKTLEAIADKLDKELYFVIFPKDNKISIFELAQLCKAKGIHEIHINFDDILNYYQEPEES